MLTSRSKKCLQVITFILLVLSVLLGIALIVTSCLLLKRPASFHLIPEYNIEFICIVTVSGGLTAIIIAAVCIYALCKLERGLIFICGILLCVVAAYLLLISLLCINESQPVTVHSLFETMKHKYGKSRWECFTNDLDWMQNELGCCGAYDYCDYQKFAWTKLPTSETVPASCCRRKYVGCNHRGIHGSRPETAASIYTIGCAERMKNWANHYICIIGKIVIALFVLLVVAAILFCVIYILFDFYECEIIKRYQVTYA
ncbi:hypothetical protein CHUAL_004435 [Chamberlinius hualienensis]